MKVESVSPAATALMKETLDEALLAPAPSSVFVTGG